MTDAPLPGILHVIEPAAGGSARAAMVLIEEQAARGYRLGLVYSPVRREAHVESSIARLVASGNVAVHEVPMRRAVHPLEDWRALQAIAHHAREFRPQILHLHSSKAGMLGRIAGLVLSPRPVIVYQPQGFAFLRRKSRALAALYRSLESATSVLVDLCVATSSDERALAGSGILRWHGAMTVVPNPVTKPVATAEAAREARASLGIPEKALMAVYVGGLVPEKRVGDLIRATAKLAAEGVDLYLAVVGSGPERNALDQVARETGAAERIKFAGYQAHPAAYQLAADIGVHACGFESFGIAVAEALALGKPVVAASAPGVRELVRHEENGLLSPVGDVDGLAVNLGRVARDPELRAALGVRAAAGIADRYSAERVTSMMEAAYRSAMG